MIGSVPSANAARAAKRPVSWGLPAFSCLSVLGWGLLWIWWPVLDGAIEIFHPRSVLFNWPLEDMLILALAVVAFLFHVAVCSATFMRRRSWAPIAVMLLPAAVLAGVGGVVHPVHVDRIQERVDSFQVGARWAISRAGGAAKLRQDALPLLAASSDVTLEPFQRLYSVPPALWPRSFRALHVISVRTDTITACIDVIILPTSCFADTFGYIITSEDAPDPDIKALHGRQGHRLWKIDKGIFLYEEW